MRKFCSATIAPSAFSTLSHRYGKIADSLIFFNPRYRFNDQDSRQYNVGFGYRHRVDGWVLGGYGYVDRDRSALDHYFSQATLGAEALSTDWKFRVNDYQPFGTRRYDGRAATVIPTNGTLEISSTTDTSLQGDDAEAGYRIPVYDANSKNQIWVYGGGYHFAASDARTVEGPRAHTI